MAWKEQSSKDQSELKKYQKAKQKKQFKFERPIRAQKVLKDRVIKESQVI